MSTAVCMCPPSREHGTGRGGHPAARKRKSTDSLDVSPTERKNTTGRNKVSGLQNKQPGQRSQPAKTAGDFSPSCGHACSACARAGKSREAVVRCSTELICLGCLVCYDTDILGFLALMLHPPLVCQHKQTRLWYKPRIHPSDRRAYLKLPAPLLGHIAPSSASRPATKDTQYSID